MKYPLQIVFIEISNCESDIAFLAARHDAATRQWLLKDFDKWFSDPGDSRAYVLLGDPGVGKSVMAGVLAQRSRKAGHLGAAYFCRHNDSTRNDPRYLLGTIASQLCECSSEYNSIMGGEGGIRKLLGNSNLGVQELFTKLLQEPLYMNHSTQRKLVVVDALDETQYESREDFLDLIMNRFPLLPNWLVFFITSRPENTVQLSLKKYNPCVRICAGNVEHHSFYQQHEQDIKLFLRNNVDFSRLPFAVDDVANKCNGSFLYAFYIAKDLNAPMQSGKSFDHLNDLDDLFPGDFDSFLRKNFKRVFDKVGSSLFKKLFGCAIAAPAPLPVSFVSYVLQREKSNIPKQHVLDALSLVMVLSQTFAFVHNLIPAWLTDEDEARELFIDRNIEANYLKDVIHEILFGFIREESQDVALIKPDLLDYVLCIGIRFLNEFPGKDSSETVFSCLTSFKYIQNRIQSRRVFSLIEDYKLAVDCPFHGEDKMEILLAVCSALERNVYFLSGCPFLLHSCLQNALKVVQDNVVIPDGVSTTWLQWNRRSFPSNCLHRDSNLFAVSPDGKLLGHINRHGKNIVFFDSCSLEVIHDIMLERFSDLVLKSNCLEFSPDGKFLFFGRLDLWVSLEKGNLEEFPQFLGKKKMYEWGSFTVDQQWIVVKRNDFSPALSDDSCCCLCLLNYLCLWAAKEIAQGQERDKMCCFPDRLRLDVEEPRALQDVSSRVPAMPILLNILRGTHHPSWYVLLKSLFSGIGRERQVKCRYCPSRKKSETLTLTVVRDFIISHYSMIFKYQVWDLKTGKSALEQAFSSVVQMSPFTYFCHLETALDACWGLFSGVDNAPSLCKIALLTTVFYSCTYSFVLSFWNRPTGSSPFLEAFHDATLLELQNLPGLEGRLRFFSTLPCVSPDRKWVAIRRSDLGWKTVLLYRGQHQHQHNRGRGYPVHVIQRVLKFAFTNDSELLLYLTVQKSLHTLSLATGTILTSVSGVSPLSSPPEKQSGYRFQDDNEVDNILAFKDFPLAFLSSILPFVRTDPMQVAFASADAILVLYANSTLALMENDGTTTASETYLQRRPSDDKQQVKKAQFSPDGKVIVTHQGTSILLYRTMPGSDKASTDHGKCPNSVFETKDDFNVMCFTFSADSTLLLFCILRNIGSSFFVWNVQGKVLSASFDSPGLMSEDCCCCFSLDNKELIICSELYIEFWDHASHPCRLLRKVETGVPYTEVDKFTHCTVSPENDLLAYCITDRILLCPLNASTDQSIWQLPRAHLGKVEFCQFLRGNRYLISYGVDGALFLWDLSEWKAVGFANIAQGRENIVSMAVSTEGDKVVCVTSFGRLNIIKPCGLKDAMLSKLPLPKWMGSEKMTEAFRGKVRRPTAAIENLRFPDNTEDVDAAEMRIAEMEFMLCSDDNEYSDEDGDEFLD